MSNGQQLAVHGRIGPGTWSLQERETLTSLAGVAADTLRSADLIAHLRNITDGQSEAVIAVDTTGTVTFANPAAVRVLGTESVERTVGMAVADVCHLQSNGKEIDLLSVAVKGITVEDADAVLVVEKAGSVDRPTGHTLDVSYSCSPLAEGDDISGAVLVMRDVSERRAFQDAMTYRAMHDELTGLPNRRSFLERLDAALQEETQNALIFFDLDRFKLVNDSFGHLVGDQLLIQFSQRLARHSDPRGITARLSGRRVRHAPARAHRRCRPHLSGRVSHHRPARALSRRRQRHLHHGLARRGQYVDRPVARRRPACRRRGVVRSEVLGRGLCALRDARAGRRHPAAAGDRGTAAFCDRQ
jgi:PAS domain S-box-containing protein